VCRIFIEESGGWSLVKYYLKKRLNITGTKKARESWPFLFGALPIQSSCRALLELGRGQNDASQRPP